jgi:hypothetical protein
MHRIQTLRIRCVRLAIFASALAVLTGFNIAPAAACPIGAICPPGTPTGSAALFFESLGQTAQQTSQIGLTGIQQQIWAIEDRLQRRPPVTPGPPAFAEEDPAANPVIDSAFAALGYSGKPRDVQNPILVKAVTPPAQPSLVSYSAWGQGTIDYQSRTGTSAGFNIGSNTLTAAALAGGNATVQSLTSASDALVLGLLAGDTAASVRNADGSTARVDGPSVGAYGAYVNRGFSIDGTFKTDFLGVDQTVAGLVTPFGLINYTAAGNVNFKQDLGSWWYQPTAGISDTRTVWNGGSKAFGMTDGTDVRVQGGARFGSGFDWAGTHFDGTLTLLAYDDVLISGGTLAVATGTPLTPTEQGKVFGQAIGRLEAQLTKNWSASVEGEFRGSTDIYGLAGRIGVTYTFN